MVHRKKTTQRQWYRMDLHLHSPFTQDSLKAHLFGGHPQLFLSLLVITHSPLQYDKPFGQQFLSWLIHFPLQQYSPIQQSSPHFPQDLLYFFIGTHLPLQRASPEAHLHPPQ